MGILEKIKEIATVVWEKSPRNTELVFMNESNCMSFYRHDGKIFIQPDLILAYFMELKKQGIGFSKVEALTEYVVAHELGHSLDPLIQENGEKRLGLYTQIDEAVSILNEKRVNEIHQEITDLTLQGEKRAYRLSRQFRSAKSDINVWNQMDHIHLKKHEEFFIREKRVFAFACIVRRGINELLKDERFKWLKFKFIYQIDTNRTYPIQYLPLNRVVCLHIYPLFLEFQKQKYDRIEDLLFRKVIKIV